MTEEYQLDSIKNHKNSDEIYTDGIDTEPIHVGSGKDIIKYILKNDLDLTDWKLVKRGRK